MRLAAANRLGFGAFALSGTVFTFGYGRILSVLKGPPGIAIKGLRIVTDTMVGYRLEELISSPSSNLTELGFEVGGAAIRAAFLAPPGAFAGALIAGAAYRNCDPVIGGATEVIGLPPSVRDANTFMNYRGKLVSINSYADFEEQTAKPTRGLQSTLENTTEHPVYGLRINVAGYSEAQGYNVEQAERGHQVICA